MPIRLTGSSRLMRGVANAGMHELCTIERNNGTGWSVLHASTPCNVQHIDYRPTPYDPQDASTETGETVAIHLIRELVIRIGDRVNTTTQPLRKWIIGGGNLSESLASFLVLRALRPTAATPYTRIEIIRWNQNTETNIKLPVQVAQVTLSTRVPVPVGQVSQRGGVIFGPEGYPPLDIQIGDQFQYAAGMTAYVTWVTPDPSERREAVFYINVPNPFSSQV